MPNIPTNICRICEKSWGLSLTDITLDENQELVNKFLTIANVSFSIYDKLPKYFCQYCIDTLSTFYQFKEKCENAEKKFLALLSEENDTIKIECEELKRDDDYTTSMTLNPLALELNVTEAFLHGDLAYSANTINLMKLSPTDEEIDFGINQQPFIKEERCAKNLNKNSNESKIHNTKQISILFKCDICRKQLKTKEKLEKHMRIHTRSYICEICSKMFKRKHNLFEHMGTHGDKSFKCDKCEKGFATEDYLRRHSNLHNKKYKCLSCSAEFQRKESLDSHTIAHHTSDTVKSCMCTICGEITVSARKFKMHMLKHTDERPFACNLCDAKFKIKTLLSSHMRVHTGEKPFNCLECDRGFAKKSHLTDHQKTHSNERPYECPICKEKFKTKVTISHMTRHTGEKPFTCEYCEKTFTMDSKLRRHIRIHTGEKPFACTLCNVGYNKLPFLEKHLKIHDGGGFFDGSGGGGHHPIHSHEQFFKCTWCSGAFLTRRSLQFHQTKHSGGKSYVCNVCGQGFSTTQNLNEHIAELHGNTIS